MCLSDFIVERQNTILAHWDEAARILYADTAANCAFPSTEHARRILLWIVADMRTPQTEDEQLDKSRGLALREMQALLMGAERHALERHLAGCTVAQIVGEYRALRSSVVRLWMKDVRSADLSTLYALTRFNEAVDQQIASSLLQLEQLEHQATHVALSDG